MRTIETKLYQYEELSEEAKERAIESFYLMIDYPYFDDAMKSIKAFCDLFSVSVTNYALGGYRESFISTNATNENFRNCTLKDAEALKDKGLTGYCLDDTLTYEYWAIFKQSGDAKLAFFSAIEEARKDIERDIEYTYSRQGIEELIQCNDYEFTENGKLH